MALMKNVPLDQARAGDWASATVGETTVRGRLVSEYDHLKRDQVLCIGGIDLLLRALPGESVVIEREVPDLPTEPGAVFRANLQRGGERRTMMRVKAGSGLVFEAAEAGGEAPEVFAANEIDLATVEVATVTWPEAP